MREHKKYKKTPPSSSVLASYPPCNRPLAWRYHKEDVPYPALSSRWHEGKRNLMLDARSRWSRMHLLPVPSTSIKSASSWYRSIVSLSTLQELIFWTMVCRRRQPDNEGFEITLWLSCRRSIVRYQRISRLLVVESDS